jgi:outer membrane biosynthesis protein TonB
VVSCDQHGTTKGVTGMVVTCEPGAVGARLGAIAVVAVLGGIWLVSRSAPPAASGAQSASPPRVAAPDPRPARLIEDRDEWSALEVVPGALRVRGGLRKEIVRRIVRRHVNELKFCYEKERLKNPALAGRVDIQFGISKEGAVMASIVTRSTTNDATVDGCIAQAVRRWEFPKPQGGGVVVVSYPFVLVWRRFE